MEQTYPKQQSCSLMEIDTSKFVWCWRLQLTAEGKEKPNLLQEMDVQGLLMFGLRSRQDRAGQE